MHTIAAVDHQTLNFEGSDLELLKRPCVPCEEAEGLKYAPERFHSPVVKVPALLAFRFCNLKAPSPGQRQLYGRLVETKLRFRFN